MDVRGVFNIASGSRHTLLELAECLNELLGTAHLPEFGPPRPGDVKHSQADGTRAEELLGYTPLVEFGAGLERTLGWYQSRMGLGESVS